jgi:hypothetical protein
MDSEGVEDNPAQEGRLGGTAVGPEEICNYRITVSLKRNAVDYGRYSRNSWGEK